MDRLHVNRKAHKAVDRIFQSKRRGHERKKKLDQLCERFNLKSYMGELFLSELKLSTEPGDEEAKSIARLLGLM